MGRQLRKVPKDWTHPRDDRGRFKPLYDGINFHQEARKWLDECAAWEAGTLEGLAEKKSYGCVYYWDYAGNPPNADDYMLVGVPAEERTHFMLYETTSEGTPCQDCPAFETIEELCAWAEVHATTFGTHTTTKEEWRRMLDDNFVYATDPRMPGAMFV